MKSLLLTYPVHYACHGGLGCRGTLYIVIYDFVSVHTHLAIKWSSIRFLWQFIANISWRERTSKMQLIRCLLSNFLSQHVSGNIMPIIGRIRPNCRTVNFTQCTQLTTQLHMTTANHSLHTPGRTAHAVGHGLILLMMGITMPETCWDRKFDNKHRISCVFWFSLFTKWSPFLIYFFITTDITFGLRILLLFDD